MGKLINTIPGSRLLIPGSALRTHVESLSKPSDVSVLKALPGKHDLSKDTHLLISISSPTKIQQFCVACKA